MDRQSKPAVDGECDTACLGLVKDIVSLQTVANCLQRIGSKPITYDNSFPKINWSFLSQS